MMHLHNKYVLIEQSFGLKALRSRVSVIVNDLLFLLEYYKYEIQDVYLHK